MSRKGGSQTPDRWLKGARYNHPSVRKKIGGTELPGLSCEMDGQPGRGGIRNRDGDCDNKIWEIMFEYD